MKKIKMAEQEGRDSADKGEPGISPYENQKCGWAWISGWEMRMSEISIEKEKKWKERNIKISNSLKLRRPSEKTIAGSVAFHKGRKLTAEHKEKIKKGLKKCMDEGRGTKGFSVDAQKKGLAASKNPESIKKRVEKNIKIMKGRSQSLDKCTGAHENNKAAIYWELISPDKKIHRFKNLNNFIRENPHLFTEYDTEVISKGTTRAAICLRQLFYVKKKWEMSKFMAWLDNRRKKTKRIC